MLFTLIPGLLAALTLAAPNDTTITVQHGQRLAISLHSGSITVRTWARSAVRVQRTDDDGPIQISNDGRVINVSADGRHGPEDAELEITVPAWLELNLNGVNTDMVVTGSQGPLRVETVQGDVTVDGGRGQVSVSSVEGSVTLSNAQGHIEATSVNDDLTVSRITGSLHAESVNGDVSLDQISSSDVDATSVNGDIDFSGALAARGLYRFSTHNGDITLDLPASTSATFYLSTFQGGFDSDFPVSLTGTRPGKRYTVTLGNGAARVEAESFMGDINLRRNSGATNR